MAPVLVVDDEFGIAELIEMALEDEGHRVVAAVNGRQGLERLAEAAPDLVLLDYMMPILDGPGMLRAMQADPALRAVPMVLMTSLDEATARRDVEEDGLVGTAVIQQRVTELLDVRRAILAADPNFYSEMTGEMLVEA